MASTVTILYGPRRATIKVTPIKLLSEVRAEACTKFGLSNAQAYGLKRNGVNLDLSVQVRFTSLTAGGRLELVKSKAPTTPVDVTLRTATDPIETLTDKFPSSESIWGILRSFERKARASGRKNVNLTERGSPSGTSGSGRLLYEMPSVRIANKELASFTELQQTLGALGFSSGRVLLVIRFKQVTVPYEEALEEIGTFSPKEEEEESVAEASGSAVEEENLEDVTMPDTVTEQPAESNEMSETSVTAEPTQPEISSEPLVPQDMEVTGDAQRDSGVQGSTHTIDGEKPIVSVFRPSESSTLAAAQISVPDTAYEIGIAEATRAQANLNKQTIGRRLASDKEKQEKQNARMADIEKIEHLTVKVRFPDGYISQQEFKKHHTAQDLYDIVRSTLRNPEQPFSLMIPPTEKISETPKRLTVDLGLRSGASVHLVWGPEVPSKIKKQPALKDEFLKASQALPMPIEPDAMEVDEKASGSQGSNLKKAGGPSGSAGSSGTSGKEEKLKKLLGFGRKK